MPKQAKVEPQKASTSKVITVERTEVSNFDESLTFLKEKFDAEMKRVDEEMATFTRNLKGLYSSSNTENASKSSNENSAANWESLANSPLVHGEGDDKILKLQFDLSAFNPDEVKVELNGELLVVSAHHEEESDSSTMHRDFRREFLLPRNTDPESIVSNISRDGVVTVQVKLPVLSTVAKAETDTVLMKQVSKKNKAKTSADPRVAPGAPPGNLIPQSPMSSSSPVSPEKISTQILRSQDTSKQSSNIKTQQPQRREKKSSQ